MISRLPGLASRSFRVPASAALAARFAGAAVFARAACFATALAVAPWLAACGEPEPIQPRGPAAQLPPGERHVAGNADAANASDSGATKVDSGAGRSAGGALEAFAAESEDGELYGYRDASGRVVIEPRFVMAFDFNAEGVAPVVKENRWVYIDRNGRALREAFVYDNGPDYFQEGLARFVGTDGRIGFMNRSAQIVIEARFGFARPFHEERAAVCQGCREVRDGEYARVTGGRWGYIDRSGEIVIPLSYAAAGDFADGVAVVELAGEGGRIRIDRGGRIVSRN